MNEVYTKETSCFTCWSLELCTTLIKRHKLCQIQCNRRPNNYNTKYLLFQTKCVATNGQEHPWKFRTTVRRTQLQHTHNQLLLEETFDEVISFLGQTTLIFKCMSMTQFIKHLRNTVNGLSLGRVIPRCKYTTG